MNSCGYVIWLKSKRTKQMEKRSKQNSCGIKAGKKMPPKN